MAYRNNNRRSGGGGGGAGGGVGGGGGNGGGNNFGNNYGGGGGGGGNRINPWDAGCVGGGRGNNDALTFANSLINNLLRNQNTNQVPSLLDGVQSSSRFDDINGYNFIRNRFGGKNRNGNGRGIRKPDAVVRSKHVLAKNAHKPPNHPSNPTASDSASAYYHDRDLHRSGKGANKKGNNSQSNHVGGPKDKASLSKASPYMEVSNDFLYCHMCDKHMYDATSFENHITGRTHRVMKESIEESYRMRATLLRQEARIAEQLKTIEIDRLKRMGKAKNYYKVREYCPMCELFFYGHIIAHRRSEKHLDLKKFLHPKCDDCELEFHNRTEYDDHLLSVVHMKNCKSKPSRLDIERKAKQLTISTMSDELLDIREETAPKKRKDKDSSGKEGQKKIDDGGKASGGGKPSSSTVTSTEQQDASGSGGAGENGDLPKDANDDGDEHYNEHNIHEDSVDGVAKQSEAAATNDDCKLLADEDIPEDEAGKEEESEDCILDYKPGDEIAPEIDNKLPRYKKNRALGISLIGKLECVECCICHKYFDSEATGEVHARTHSHYRAFIRFLNEKAMEVRIAQKRAAVALEEAEAAKKKQKLIDNEKKDNAQQGAGSGADEQQNGGGGDAVAEKKESELYDPSEATESGDASMAEDSKSDDGQNGPELVEPMETEVGAAADDADQANNGSNEDEEDSGKEDEDDDDELREKDDKDNTKDGSQRRGNRNTRSGRYASRN